MSSARGRVCLALILCASVAIAASVANVKGLGPFTTPGSVSIAGASAQATVDLPRGSLIQLGVQEAKIQSLTARTLLLGEVMTTPPVLAQIARRAGIPPSQLSGATSFVANIPEQALGPDLEVRANQIIDARAAYHLSVQPDPNIPRLEIYARAPSVPAAARLADAAVPGLRDYLRAQAVRNAVQPASQVRVQQQGPALAAIVNNHAKYEIAGLTFLIAFGLCGGLLLFGRQLRRGWKTARRGERSDADATASSVDGPAAPAAEADNWPHTTRVLPWMIAAFLGVLWLVPFDSIQIGGSLPIDLKFDRIVLPLIVLAWALVLAAGGRGAPRVRVTWVHAGVFTFAGVTCLSIVLGARYLNDNLILDQGVKRLALLVAYVTFFVMIASIVRPAEVKAFLRFSLILAVVAAIGTIIQYRSDYNIFYDLAHKLLPGFQVAAASGGVDDLGRRLVTGPAELPLEAVGMFTMALPIALTGITDATRWRGRLLYGLAAALLLAASLTTERKSGLLGPLAVILTLAYFKRGKLLRLAPLAVVLVIAVKILAPGAIGGVTGQLAPNRLGVTTVDDRVLRYDAIRPDVWLHLAFGQGFGTYSVRVLDNELLGRLIEGGVLGLGAYVVMLGAMVFVAASAIRRRAPGCQAVAPVVAAAAASVLVMSAMYDLMGYPHDPYILLSLAGLLAVAVRSERPSPAPVRASAGVKRSPRPSLEEAWSY